MGRWDFSDPDRERLERETSAPSVGRGGGDAPADDLQNREEWTPVASGIAPERRSKHQDRERTYSLRQSEIDAMADIGRFRALDQKDLVRFLYQGRENQAGTEIANLRRQGLIEEKTIFRANNVPRRMVTLTERGQRLLRTLRALPAGQKTYRGFVKPKEVEHDADLYKVYQKAAQRIREQGGQITRVRLDFELKASIGRARESAGTLPADMRERWLGAVAAEHGLATDGKTIHLPDLQVEYQTPDGRIERENLELVSRNYREQGIRGKASAGFTMYARASDAARIRRALHDTGLVREVFAI
jgi:hypothetical protein